VTAVLDVIQKHFGHCPASLPEIFLSQPPVQFLGVNNFPALHFADRLLDYSNIIVVENIFFGIGLLFLRNC